MARNDALTEVYLRDEAASAVLEHLDAGRSVLIVGPDGVGKTSVIHAVAKRMAQRNEGAIAELGTVTVLSGTKYLGEWQTKLLRIAEAASESDTVLYITDIGNLSSAGHTVQSKTSFLDALKPKVQSGATVLLGEVSPRQLQRIERVPGFSELFAKVAVEPLSADDALSVLEQRSEALELPLGEDSLRAMMALTSRFLPARPQPAPALMLITQVADYLQQKRGVGEDEPVDRAFVERVFSIYSGLPRFIVSRSETRSAAEIRQWFRERIVGQQEAIESVVQAIALFKAGLHDPKRPLGTFFFVGPTGVGKTELARAMATFLYGSPHRLLRFDLSEFKDFHAFQALLGNPDRPDEPARLIDPVRAQPFQVVLFDEIEKAHSNVWDVLLGLLDEGRLTTPRGQTVDFRNTFLIATSNVGAQEASKTVGFGDAGDGSRGRQRLLSELQKHFRPEFLGRFQHVVPFHALGEEHVRRIARMELRQLLSREGITGRNLVVDIDEQALSLVIQRGFDTRWGARALKQELQRQIMMPLALLLMEKGTTPGQVLKVTGRSGHIQIRQLDTATSRAAVREAEPVHVDGQRMSRADLHEASRNLRESIEQLALQADESFAQEEQARLTALRQEPEFWRHPDAAARTLRDLDLATRTIDRLDWLRQRVDAFEADLSRSDTREKLARLAHRLQDVQGALDTAFLELVWMGRAGHWDAIVEIRPMGAHRLARDVLVEMYTSWAAHQGLEVDWLRDPRSDDEPAMFAVKGPYAFGLLQYEAGVHKVRDAEAHTAASVRVAAWTDRMLPVAFAEHHALKAIGTYGGKVRSRLECQDGLVLQNGRTLAENRDVAAELVGSWAVAAPVGEGIVRRYDLAAPLVRDVLTGTSSGRPDALSPERLHTLLCQRVEVVGLPPDAA